MNSSVRPFVDPTHKRPFRAIRAIGIAALVGLLGLAPGCSDDSGDSMSRPEAKPTPIAAEAPTPASGKSTTPDDLPLALVLALSAFAEREPGATGMPVPLPAELEFIVRRDGEWVNTTLTDPDSNVFHKALAYTTPDGSMALLTGAGSKAMVKLWKKEGGAFVSQTLWEKDFGGRFSRIRDIEVRDVDAVHVQYDFQRFNFSVICDGNVEILRR